MIVALAAPSVLVPWAVAGLIFLGAMGLSKRVTDTEETLDRTRTRLEATLTSMVWTFRWSEQEAAERPRAYMAHGIEYVRQALDVDFVRMGEIIEEIEATYVPPRRMPRYPQIPPYLAGEADVVKMPTHGVIPGTVVHEGPDPEDDRG